MVRLGMPPIIKKLYDIGPYEVLRVSGKWIRDNIDPDFTNFDHGYHRSYIKKDQIWLDVENKPDEEIFFVSNALEQIRQMQAGKSYGAALKAGEAVELRERNKGKPTPKDVGDVILRNLGEHKGCRVKLVNGKLVRKVHPSFTEGGHDLVYDFIKRKSGPRVIWVDNDLVPSEIPPTIEHEGDEREDMSKGMSYPQAHQRALQSEWVFRNKRT